MSKLRNHLRARLASGCISAADMLEELTALEEDARCIRAWPILGALVPALVHATGTPGGCQTNGVTLEERIADARRELHSAWVRTDGDASGVTVIALIGRAVFRLGRAMERVASIDPEAPSATMHCPVCTNPVVTMTRTEYGEKSARGVTCPSCSTALYVPEPETRGLVRPNGRSYHPWPPALRIVRKH